MTPRDHGTTPRGDAKTSKLSGPRKVSAPPLTVWLGSAMYTFPAGRDATVGRERDCDIWLRDTDPATFTLISRVHAILRYDGTRWVVIDKSQNGIFIDGVRRPVIAIRSGQSVSLGNPRGPRLTFRVAAGWKPPERTLARPIDSRPRGNTGQAPPFAPPVDPRPVRQPPPPVAPHPHPPPPPPPAAPYVPPPVPPPPVRPRPLPPARQPDLAERVSDTMRAVLSPRTGGAPSGSKSVGRAKSNDVVVDDYLASRVHAYLVGTPDGVEIRDNGSSNGTFVNGAPITRAVLRDGDVVTIGNTDLVASGDTLVERVAPPRTGGLVAQGLGLTIDGHKLLTDVSFAAPPGTLTAVIGPSGAGKTTLIKLISGSARPSVGVVSFDGHAVHAEYASMRSRIGMVPQDDVVHRQLSLEHALNYAAELRLPPDTSKSDRREVVERVLGELELTKHRKTRVDKLSGGQRKRASVAMELLTGPSLLILDEPTSGLDPALDRQVMTMLRNLADAGRVVIVVTHSLTYVNMCDQVLLLAPGGKTAYADSPAKIGSAMGTTDWADIFARVSTDPDGVHREFLERNPQRQTPQTPTDVAPLGTPPHTSLWRQVFTLMRRQTRLMTSDRGYFAFLTVLPFVLGVLSLAVPGDTGLGLAGPHGDRKNPSTS